MNVNDAQECDIAVIGSGAAGAATALALAHAGFSVALVGPPPPRADGRTIALLGLSWRMMADWGVVQALGDTVAPLSVMRIVDDTGSLFRQPPVDFRAAEMDLDAFGWNVEATALVTALTNAAQAHELVSMHPVIATALEPEGGGWRVSTPEGDIIAPLVVGADGRNSIVRKTAGIEAKGWSYPQSALTVILKHSREHRDASTEFHTRSGPCTLVPLPGKRSSLVWMAAPEEGARLLALDDASLAMAIERQCHAILGHLEIDGPRGLVPMSGLEVERFSAPSLALVGEAAHVFPPIGAQGLNLGFRDIADLVEAISDAREAGRSIGGAEAMAAYDRARKPDVKARTMAVDTMNRSLLSGLLPVDFARGLGLLALANIGPLRRLAMRKGLGAGRFEDKGPGAAA
jgi:2-octaprenyl-6-methoxyphenol hydroxylase